MCNDQITGLGRGHVRGSISWSNLRFCYLDQHQKSRSGDRQDGGLGVRKANSWSVGGQTRLNKRLTKSCGRWILGNSLQYRRWGKERPPNSWTNQIARVTVGCWHPQGPWVWLRTCAPGLIRPHSAITQLSVHNYQVSSAKAGHTKLMSMAPDFRGFALWWERQVATKKWRKCQVDPKRNKLNSK